MNTARRQYLHGLAAFAALLAMLLRALLPALHDHGAHHHRHDHGPHAAGAYHCAHAAAADADHDAPQAQRTETVDGDHHDCLACAVELEAPGHAPSLPAALPAHAVAFDAPQHSTSDRPADRCRLRPPSRAPPTAANA